LGLGVPTVFPSNGSVVWRPPSLHRVPWGEFPGFLGTTQALRLPSNHPAGLRCRCPAVPPVRSLLRSSRDGARSRRPRGWYPGSPHAGSRAEPKGSPRFLVNPPLDMPWSRTPAELPHQAIAVLPYCLPHLRQRRPPRSTFRGSIPRPAHSLCTLHQTGRPVQRNTRFQLLAKLCWVGFAYPQGSNERFPASSRLPPFPGFAWRTVKGPKWGPFCTRLLTKSR